MDKVAVILASYNGEEYIREQITSIMEGSYQDFRIYIFDDGSRDSTENIVRKLQEKYPDKIVWNRNDRNYGVAMNFIRGIRSVDAEYYMLCDQDDIWLGNKIADTLECVQNNEVAEDGATVPVAVYADAYMADFQGSRMGITFQKFAGLDPKNTELPHLLIQNAAIGCTMMFNSALAKLIDEGSSLMKMHDFWIALLARLFGKLVYLDKPLLLYRQHGNNVVGGVSQWKYLKSALSQPGKLRKSVYQLCAQAGELARIYRGSLTEEQLKILQEFAELPELGWMTRRVRIIKGNYRKTGFFKQIGVLAVI